MCNGSFLSIDFSIVHRVMNFADFAGHVDMHFAHLRPANFMSLAFTMPDVGQCLAAFLNRRGNHESQTH